jgi:hypothetical protein
MAGKKDEKSERKGLPTDSPRGNMDELESLRTIISENPRLMTKVLEKIKHLRDANRGKPSQSSGPAKSDSK